MSSDVEPQNRRVLTLVQYCQRVATTHVDFISSFGDSGDIRYELIEPILQSCSADTLLRLEQSSPYIQRNTSDLWKLLCFKSYPLTRDQYALEEPPSWRDQYYLLRTAEAKRLEEVASRIRTQRMEAEERKKEREVKLTDRLPPSKRSRTGGWSTGPTVKTLFQKTKSEASKLQRTMYTSRMIPPMIQGKRQRVLPGAPSAKPPAPLTSGTSSTTCKAIIVKPAMHQPLKPSPSLSKSITPPTGQKSDHKIPTPPERSIPASSSPSKMFRPSPQLPVLPSEPRIPKTTPKKDPMASLFMPKHRAHSQLAGTTSRIRTSTSSTK